MGIVGEACLPSNAYYLWTPDYTLYSGVHVCCSEHSDSSFVYRFMSLDYGLGTMTATLIVLGFNDTSTLEGHFVSSPREREKRDRRDSRDESGGQRRKRNRNESEETEEIKTFPLYPYPLQG